MFKERSNQNSMRKSFLLAFFIFNISISNACSCLRTGVLEGQKSSDFVFTGKVIEVNEIVTKEKITNSNQIVDYKRYEFVFEIKHIHKGKKNNYFLNNRVTIITSGIESNCGYYFNLNKRYLIYAYKEKYKLNMKLNNQKAEKEYLTTDLCTRTRPIKFFTFFEQLLLELT